MYGMEGLLPCEVKPAASVGSGMPSVATSTY